MTETFIIRELLYQTTGNDRNIHFRELLQQTSGNDTNIHYLELLYQTEIVRRGRSGASVRVYRTRNYDFSTGCSLRGVVVRVAFSSSSFFFIFFFTQ